MLKQGIGLGLLCIAGHAFSANITVTTTDDVVKADDQCSLREAIEYVNQGMPEAGYNGCGGKETTAKIMLKANTEYILNNQVRISKDLSFGSEYITDITNSNSVIGKQNAIIKMAGKDRLFEIEKVMDTSSTEVQAMINVTFDEITLKGCTQSICKDQGGLIYNKESLTLKNSQLLNGSARQGGAIYNSGGYVANTSRSFISITNTLMQGNKAVQGGVVYAEIPSFIIKQSVIRDNEVTDNSSSNFEVKNKFSEAELNAIGSLNTYGLVNSTIFNNKGYVVKVYDAMQVNNVTMILNSMGLIIDAPSKTGYVVNSIIAQNGAADCTTIAGGEANQISNNLYSVGCGGYKGTELGAIKLISANTPEGKCDYNDNGILCPFSEVASHTLGYFLPRILPSYTSIKDSPIINKGTLLQEPILRCSPVDQRGESRGDDLEVCDRGAIELKVSTSTEGFVGQDILYGQTAKFSIVDQLKDGELVSAENCKQIFNRDVDENGKPWQIGCLKTIQTYTPSKGTTTISQDGEVTYTPNGNWDGADIFEINVVTTTTSFNKSDNPYITLSAQIVQRKPDDFKNYKVKTSGGSLGILSIIGLIGLVGYRRIKYK
ncbi:rhombotarget A [Acinetobacter wuhouensis]|uniref:Rhombotarget A n=1 Tax=Acinetobacter wuhouensis TaxID=1879050 RepID=A0A3G2T257_9GAMM|nr:rhombotarget A [Acinetobacter wuhouensis]AYO53887.1 rhombotarget A [Acinetobacter wuhouensis]